MNQLLAIRVFARVVESGSFTKAADSLDLPKTTVSKLIRELETHLGVRLLQRTTRRLTVTADGTSYYQLTNRLVHQLEDIDQGFSQAQGLPRGKLRVDIGGSTATLLVIPALPDFFARYPDIQLELGVSDRPVDLISERVDCVVRGGPLGEQQLAVRRLGEVAWSTCATPAYLERHGTPQHPKDLAQHQMVTYQAAGSGRPIPARFQRGDERHVIDGKGIISVNESNAHLAAGLAGLGIIHTFHYTVKAHLDRGELVPILSDWQPEAYPFHVLYPPNRHLSNRVRVFIDWLVERFAQVD
ncbi:MAG: LysR family transcriptional regulator [Pseudomonas sp.]